MVSDYDDAATFAEAFDKHLDFAGMHPSLAPEFRSICADADKEIAALRANLKACEKEREKTASHLRRSERERADLIRGGESLQETMQHKLDASNERVTALEGALEEIRALAERLEWSQVCIEIARIARAALDGAKGDGDA